MRTRTRVTWLALTLTLVAAASLSAQSTVRIRKLYPKTAQCCVFDAAHFLSPADSAQIDGALKHLKDSTGFDVAVVTLSTIDDLDPNDVALQIGRDWGVGSAGGIADPQHARGMVILVVPKTASQRGQIATQLARGAEGIFTDAAIGEIRRRGLDDFRAGNYGAGLEKLIAGIEPAIRATAPARAATNRARVPAGASDGTEQTGDDIGPVVIVAIGLGLSLLLVVIIVRAVRRDRRGYRDYKRRQLTDPTNAAPRYVWFDSSVPSTPSSGTDSGSSSSDFGGGGDYGGGGGSDSF